METHFIFKALLLFTMAPLVLAACGLSDPHFIDSPKPKIEMMNETAAKVNWLGLVDNVRYPNKT